MAQYTVPLHRTASGLSHAQWTRSRASAAYRALRDAGLGPGDAWDAAIAITAQWARETGWGASEYDYALGNIRVTPAWNGAVHFLQGNDDRAPAPYRAYRSLDSGVVDAVQLLTSGSRYRPAFQRLLASRSQGPFRVGGGTAIPMDATTWYSEIMRAGYNPWSQRGVDEYDSIVGTVARWAGPTPPPEASPGAKVFFGASLAFALGVVGYLGVRAARS